MADLGLLAGLAGGIQKGFDSYRTERDYQDKKAESAEEKAMKAKMYKLQLMDKGMQESPDGLLGYSQETLDKRGLDAEKTRAEIEKLRADAKRKDEGDPLATELKHFRIEKARAEAAEAAKKAADPYHKLNQSDQIQAKGLLEKRTKRQTAMDEMDAAVKQLEDPKKPEDEKVIIGQMLLKKLNDPEFSDAVGAEEVKRLGSYLEMFSLSRPGSTFGRDLPRFTKQVRNKKEFLEKAGSSADSRLQGMGLLQQPERIAAKPGDIVNVNGVRYKVGDDGDSLEQIQ